jgi:hypothetical protein
MSLIPPIFLGRPVLVSGSPGDLRKVFAGKLQESCREVAGKFAESMKRNTILQFYHKIVVFE